MTIPEVSRFEKLWVRRPFFYTSYEPCTCYCDELSGRDGSDVEMGMMMLLQISEAAIREERLQVSEWQDV
jgi:hypothetical protein